ncbi:hypothetical protein [Paraburkholderia elongata]|uniref:Lipoprotein n=1 Tax=Paraburkholderia elongata TaxID=2675747 RepID=A0A972SPV1_9BURK|nr:hypothetical protein [Paraburkholderia elongata]NPT59130.1 hypothetical protein [Paraburkholderia elongata]
MKALFIAATAAICVAFAGCASTVPATNQTPTQILAVVHTDVSKACIVAQGSMASVVAMQSQLPADQQDVIGQVDKGLNDFCALHDSVSIASVTDFTKTAIPAAIKLVSASSLDQTKKIDIQIALIAFQAALNSALLQFAPAAVAVPASA